MRPSTKIILDTVAQVFEVSVESILGKSRTTPVVWARHCAYTLLRQLCFARSYPDIGRELGRDHSTIIDGHQAHMLRIVNEPDVHRMHTLAVRLASDRLDAAEAKLREEVGPFRVRVGT